MNRTAGHVAAINGLIEDRACELKQALISLAMVVVFGAITIAALWNLELHYMFPFVLGLGITGMGACYGIGSISRIRNLTRQIEALEEDLRL